MSQVFQRLMDGTIPAVRSSSPSSSVSFAQRKCGVEGRRQIYNKLSYRRDIAGRRHYDVHSRSLIMVPIQNPYAASY